MAIVRESPSVLEKLKDRHYIKHAKHEYPTGGPQWWMALFKNKVNDYDRKFAGDFSVIIIDSLNPNNYYSIPYLVIKPYLSEIYLDKLNRWILSIRHNQLCLHGTDVKIPVEKYHNIPPSNYDGLLATVNQDLDAQNETNNTDLMESRTEGNRRVIISKKIERDPHLRKEALKIHGFNCAVCNFNFETQYGNWGKQFAEVHHIIPLSERPLTNIITNPKTDLMVVCSNCHSMIHRKKGITLTIQEIKSKIINNFQ